MQPPIPLNRTALVTLADVAEGIVLQCLLHALCSPGRVNDLNSDVRRCARLSSGGHQRFDSANIRRGCRPYSRVLCLHVETCSPSR